MDKNIQKEIYKFLKKIPKGKVSSYKIVAEYFSTSPRAIGKIMGGNKDPDIFPCYKIVKSNGELGGYNGGIKEKTKKLINDGIKIVEGKVEQKYFRYPAELKRQAKYICSQKKQPE